MNVLVASQNEVDRQATEDAFSEHYKEVIHKISGADRAISNELETQPNSLATLAKGVENRIRKAKLTYGVGSFAAFVAIESGYLQLGARHYQVECAGVTNNGTVSIAYSQLFPLDDRFTGHLKRYRNATIADVMEDVLGLENTDDKAGYSGWFAGEDFSRRKSVAETVRLALCGIERPGSLGATMDAQS